jgi:hypothetical protein
MAVQIRLWHGLLALVVCLGIILGVVFGPAPPSIHEMQAEMTALQSQYTAIGEYLEGQLLTAKTLLIRTENEIAELEYLLASMSQFRGSVSYMLHENDLQTLKLRRDVTEGKISAYEDILKFYNAKPQPSS